MSQRTLLMLSVPLGFNTLFVFAGDLFYNALSQSLTHIMKFIIDLMIGFIIVYVKLCQFMINDTRGL